MPELQQKDLDRFAEYLASPRAGVDISREDIRRGGLKEYIRQAWHLIEPSTPLYWNWNLDALCDELEGLILNGFERLIANVPPGTAKSSITSVLWPTWVWTMFPERRFLCGSHKEALALRDSVRRRNVIQSQWFQARWKLPMSGDANLKSEFHNAHTGYMVALGTGGSTGYRGDILLLDDPNNATEMESEVQRDSTLLWLDQQWSSRGNKNCREVVIQQRTHQKDVTGHLLSQGGWRHLKIPMRYAGEKNTLLCKDPRTELGQLMWPELHDEKRVKLLERRLGPYGTSGQLQQEPAPLEGGIFRRAWFRPYRKLPDGLIETEDGERFNPMKVFRFMTCDPATSKKELENQNDPDYFGIGTWCAFDSPRRGPLVFLLDMVLERLAGEEQENKIMAISDHWNVAIIGVESIGYQLNLFQRIVKKSYPVREMSSKLDALYRIDSDKMARAVSATPLPADGRLYVPEYAPWLGEYLRQMTTYPNADHDDAVDVTSSAMAIATIPGILSIQMPPDVLLHEANRKRDEDDPDTDPLSEVYGSR